MNLKNIKVKGETKEMRELQDTLPKLALYTGTFAIWMALILQLSTPHDFVKTNLMTCTKYSQVLKDPTANPKLIEQIKSYPKHRENFDPSFCGTKIPHLRIKRSSILFARPFYWHDYFKKTAVENIEACRISLTDGTEFMLEHSCEDLKI